MTEPSPPALPTRGWRLMKLTEDGWLRNCMPPQTIAQRNLGSGRIGSRCYNGRNHQPPAPGCTCGLHYVTHFASLAVFAPYTAPRLRVYAEVDAPSTTTIRPDPNMLGSYRAGTLQLLALHIHPHVNAQTAAHLAYSAETDVHRMEHATSGSLTVRSRHLREAARGRGQT